MTSRDDHSPRTTAVGPSGYDVTYSPAHGNYCCTEALLFNGTMSPIDISTMASPNFSSLSSNIDATSSSYLPPNSSDNTLPVLQTVESLVGLMTFCQWYQGVHGYLSIVVCSFGIVANLMNVIVLTRRAMVSIMACPFFDDLSWNDFSIVQYKVLNNLTYIEPNSYVYLHCPPPSSRNQPPSIKYPQTSINIFILLQILRLLECNAW